MLNVGSIFALLKLRDQMSPALKTASENLKKAGTSMRQTGTSMTMGLTMPIVGMAAAAGIAFGSFEKKMNRVRALSGATGEDFNKLSDLAKDLGKTTKFSASEAADAMGFLAMAGFETTEILGALPGVLQLATSASIDLASAADITTNILTGYGRSVEEIGATNDILVKAFTSANTDLVQLGQAFKFVGPVAKGAGLQFEEVTAMLSLMGNAGIQASMAGTGLRGAITRLLNPTTSINKALRENGIITKDASGELLPMTDIIQQLGDQSVSTADMMEIFGMRAGPALVGLVSQGAGAIRELTGELEGASGTAKRIADIEMEGLNGAFLEFKAASEGVAIAVGEQLAPTFEMLLGLAVKIANWITDVLVPAFASLSPTTQTLIIGFTAFIALLGPLLIVLGQVFIAVGAMTPALVTLASSVGLTSAAFGTLWVMLSPAVILLTVLAAIAGVGFALYKLMQPMEWFQEALLKLKSILPWVSEESLKLEEQNMKLARSQEVEANRVKMQTEQFERQSGVLTKLVGEFAEGSISIDKVSNAYRALQINGKPTEDQMIGVANAAAQARASGDELDESMKQLVERLIDLPARLEAKAEASRMAAEEAEQLKAKNDALADSIKELSDELSGAGLPAQVKKLQDAWDALTPAQQANEFAMANMTEQAIALAEQGAKLTDEQQRLVEQAEAAAKALDEEAEATKKAEQATTRMDQAIRKLLKHDLDEELAFLEEKYERLAVRTDFTEEASLALGKEFQALADRGKDLTGEALRLAQAWVTDTEATKANTEAKKQADAVVKKFSLEPLRQQAAELATGFAKLTAKGDVNTYSLEQMGKEAIALRDKGIELSDELTVLADQYEDTTVTKLPNLRESLRELGGAFERMATVAGGSFGGVMKKAGEVVTKLDTVWSTVDTIRSSFKKVADFFAGGGWSSVTSMVGKLSGATDKLSTDITKVGTSATGSASSMMSSFAGVAAGIAVAATAAIALYKIFEGKSAADRAKEFSDYVHAGGNKALMAQRVATAQFAQAHAKAQTLTGSTEYAGFQEGTHGRFMDFGKGTPTVLHGKERVTTLNEAQWEKTANANLLASVEGLRSDLKNILPLHLRDAILLSQ